MIAGTARFTVVGFLVLSLGGCPPAVPSGRCRTDADCPTDQGRVCDVDKGVCVDAVCQAGTEGCPCLESGSCGADLLCLSNRCVRTGDGGVGASGDASSTGLSGAPSSDIPSSTGSSSGLASSAGLSGTSTSAPASSSGGGCPSGSSLDANPAHCGACGHNCGGGACVQGRCGAFVLTRDGCTVPWNMTVEGGTLYWTNTTTNGSVQSMVLGPGANPLVPVSTSEPFAHSISGRAGHVFWSRYNREAYQLNAVRVRRPGGVVEDVATGDPTRHPSAVYSDDGTVFWTNGLFPQDVYARDHAGGALRSSAVGTSAQGVAADADGVYVVSGGGTLYECPAGLPNNCSEVQVWTPSGSLPGVPVVTTIGGGYLVWGSDSGFLVACLLPALTCRSMLHPDPRESLNFAWGLAVDGDYLYYTTVKSIQPTSSPVTSGVFRLRLDQVGPSGTPELVVDTTSPRGLAAWEGFLYWAEQDTADPRIMAIRAPL